MLSSQQNSRFQVLFSLQITKLCDQMLFLWFSLFYFWDPNAADCVLNCRTVREKQWHKHRILTGLLSTDENHREVKLCLVFTHGHWHPLKDIDTYCRAPTPTEGHWHPLKDTVTHCRAPTPTEGRCFGGMSGSERGVISVNWYLNQSLSSQQGSGS